MVNLPNALNFKMYRMKKPEFLPTLGFIVFRLRRLEIPDLRYRRRSVLA